MTGAIHRRPAPSSMARSLAFVPGHSVLMIEKKTESRTRPELVVRCRRNVLVIEEPRSVRGV